MCKADKELNHRVQLTTSLKEGTATANFEIELMENLCSPILQGFIEKASSVTESEKTIVINVELFKVKNN